jgi:hypothetical protein
MGSDMRLGGGGRFKKLEGELADKGVRDPAALAASIGRKKYGSERFAKLGHPARAAAKEMRHGSRG